MKAMTVYIHELVYAWIDFQARFNSESRNSYMRRIIRDHIQEMDPKSWEEIADKLAAEAKRDGTEATG